MTNGALVSLGQWGIPTAAAIVASYWHLRVKIQHLGDIKLDRDKLNGDLVRLKEDMRQVRESVVRIETTLNQLPCEREGGSRERSCRL